MNRWLFPVLFTFHLSAVFSFQAIAQDTLFFRDGTFAVARLKSLRANKIVYLLLKESGDSLPRTERAVQLDSIRFRNRTVLRIGFAYSAPQFPEISEFAAYWEGRKAGMLCSQFKKAHIGLNFLSGLCIVGLPYTIHQVYRKPKDNELSDTEVQRMRSDPNYAKGFRSGMRQTRLAALLPVYLAGSISSMLGFAVFFPRNAF